MPVRAAIITLLIAAILAVGTYFALKTPISQRAAPADFLKLDEAAIRSFTIRAPGRTTQTLSRGPAADLWLLQSGDGASWPVGSTQVRGALGLLSGLASRENPAAYLTKSSETVLTFNLGPTNTLELLLAAQTLGGKGVVALRTNKGDYSSILVPDTIHRVFEEASVEAWRSTRAFAAAPAEIAEISIAAGDSRIVLGRSGARWGLSEPLTARADEQTAASLLDQLLAVKVDRFTPPSASGDFKTPAATIVVQTRRRRETPESGAAPGANHSANSSESVAHILDIGAPADVAAQTVFVRLTAILNPGQPDAVTLWGPATAILDRSLIGNISTAPEVLLSRTALDASAADVGEILVEPSSGPGARFARSIDGWKEGEGAGTPLPVERARLMDALATALCTARADDVRSQRPDPAIDAGFLRVRTLRGNDLGLITIASGSITPANGPEQPALWLGHSGIWRGYLLDKNSPLRSLAPAAPSP